VSGRRKRNILVDYCCVDNDDHRICIDHIIHLHIMRKEAPTAEVYKDILFLYDQMMNYLMKSGAPCNGIRIMSSFFYYLIYFLNKMC
jgi:hypothetical protein